MTRRCGTASAPSARARHALAGPRVLHTGAAVPHQLADRERVVEKLQLVMKARHIRELARQAIEVFHDHHIERAAAGFHEQRLVAGPVVAGRRDKTLDSLSKVMLTRDTISARQWFVSGAGIQRQLKKIRN